MTATNDTPEGEKDVTDSTKTNDGPGNEPTELEQRILELYDENGLTVFECETIAINLDEDPDDVLAAIEALVHDGELRAQPVMYERVRDD